VKVRMRIRKKEEAKYISHLDLMRALERAMRRAKLPLKFTEGFNPRPKLTFTPAIPVGITSDAEYMDVEFTKQLSMDEIFSRLNSVLPPGISLVKVDTAEGKIPLSAVNRALYTVVVDIGNATREVLEKAIEKLLSRSEINIEKKSKGKVKFVNIAPWIYDIKIGQIEDGKIELKMELAAGQQGSVTPPAVVNALQEYIPSLSVRRINRDEIFLFDNGKRIDPI